MSQSLPRTTAQLARWTQRQAAPAATGESAPVDADASAIAAAGVAGPSGTLPFIDEIQGSFGHHDVRGVGAHVGGEAQAASAALGAHGYATGNDVAFAAAPDLHLAAHEAAHVVQQRAGVQLASAIGEAGDRYERHADRAADAVVRGESAAGILDEMAAGGGGQPAVQREEDGIYGLRDTMMGMGRDLPPEVRFPLLEYGQQVPALRAARPQDRRKMLQAVEPRRAHALLQEVELTVHEQFVILEQMTYLLEMASLNTLYAVFERSHGRGEVERQMFSKLDLAMQLGLFERLEASSKARLIPFGAAPRHLAALLAYLGDAELTEVLTLLSDDQLLMLDADTPPHVADRIRRCIEPVRPVMWQAGGRGGASEAELAEREADDGGSASRRGEKLTLPRTDDQLLNLVIEIREPNDILPLFAKAGFKQYLILQAASPAQIAAILRDHTDRDVTAVWTKAWSAAGHDTMTAALRRLAADQVDSLHFQLDAAQQAQLVTALPDEHRDVIKPRW